MKVGQLTIQLHQQRLFEQACLEFYTKYPGTEAIHTAGRAVLCRKLKLDYGIDAFMQSLPELMGWFDEREAEAGRRMNGVRVAA